MNGRTFRWLALATIFAVSGAVVSLLFAGHPLAIFGLALLAGVGIGLTGARWTHDPGLEAVSPDLDPVFRELCTMAARIRTTAGSLGRTASDVSTATEEILLAARALAGAGPIPEGNAPVELAPALRALANRTRLLAVNAAVAASRRSGGDSRVLDDLAEQADRIASYCAGLSHRAETGTGGTEAARAQMDPAAFEPVPSLRGSGSR